MQNAFIAQLLKRPAPTSETAPLNMLAAEPLTDENIEMHDSALFDVVVEIDYYDGTRLRIPQEVWPEGRECPF